MNNCGQTVQSPQYKFVNILPQSVHGLWKFGYGFVFSPISSPVWYHSVTQFSRTFPLAIHQVLTGVKTLKLHFSTPLIITTIIMYI